MECMTCHFYPFRFFCSFVEELVMEPHALVRVALLGLLVTLVSSAENETSICKVSPTWSIGDEVPMNKTLGRVTVVALLQASCSFCLVQAANMGPLIKKLAGLGLDDISYMIVNDKSDNSQILFPVLQQRAPSGMPVYQQTPEQDDVWEMLNGDKDDFLIYDRCGRLIFHIRLPYSYLHYRYVEAAIRSTYFQDYCKNCSFYANITAQNTNASTANSTDPEPSPASAVTSEKKKKEPEKYQDKPRQGPSRQP
uniref:Selenoprotein P N-terminal domain-containing protein n=1 Tax=Leptobrachium leishanense TaxID=445787 RepID=A0A8C5QJM4_9ANUR